MAPPADAQATGRLSLMAMGKTEVTVSETLSIGSRMTRGDSLDKCGTSKSTVVDRLQTRILELNKNGTASPKMTPQHLGRSHGSSPSQKGPPRDTPVGDRSQFTRSLSRMMIAAGAIKCLSVGDDHGLTGNSHGVWRAPTHDPWAQPANGNGERDLSHDHVIFPRPVRLSTAVSVSTKGAK